MKNRMLSKNKGCLFFLLPKIYQLPEYYMMFARKIRKFYLISVCRFNTVLGTWMNSSNGIVFMSGEF